MSHHIATSNETHHDRMHSASDMVAQHDPTVQGSNIDPTANPSLARAMAAAAGPHDPVAVTTSASGASGTELFDLSVSPAKDESAPDARMTGGPSRRRSEHSHSLPIATLPPKLSFMSVDSVHFRFGNADNKAAATEISGRAVTEMS